MHRSLVNFALTLPLTGYAAAFEFGWPSRGDSWRHAPNHHTHNPWHNPWHDSWPNPWHHGSEHGGGGCEIACGILDNLLPGRVDYFNDTIYAAEQVYWSQQQAKTLPHCRFTPHDTQDVSRAVQVVEFTKCHFAVKSGGHAAFKGASNIQDGMTIDLKKLSTLVVSADRKTTYTGTGNHWDHVYQYLNPLDLAVVGGRNGDIGVGGLTLGGGIAFFSGFYGWACDNVNNYEVVLSGGRVVNASPKENTDLYFALRGGGNNFGIVTRMDLNTFEQGNMWGGMVVYPVSANVSMYDAFYWFNQNADPKAALIAAVACIQGSCFFANDYEYSDPTPKPAAFENFTSIANLSDTTRVTTLLNLTEELKATQPNGFRQMFMSATFENNVELMCDILDIWTADIQPLLNSTGFIPSLIFQPLTKAVISNFDRNGGNALGVTTQNGPLSIMDLAFQWNESSDDEQITNMVEGIVNKAIALAKSRGIFNEYIYQNYAFKTQDVFAGYGAKNQQKLIKISKKYDPQQVFQKLQPGYFKLSR